MMENCLTWAWRQRIFRKGKVKRVTSQFATELYPPEKRNGFLYRLAKLVPHFVWNNPQDGHWYQFTIKEEKKFEWGKQNTLMAWLSLIAYDGEVRRADEHINGTQPQES